MASNPTSPLTKATSIAPPSLDPQTLIYLSKNMLEYVDVKVTWGTSLLSLYWDYIKVVDVTKTLKKGGDWVELDVTRCDGLINID
jgi:hypothetical protein